MLIDQPSQSFCFTMSKSSTSNPKMSNSNSTDPDNLLSNLPQACIHHDPRRSNKQSNRPSTLALEGLEPIEPLISSIPCPAQKRREHGNCEKKEKVTL